MENKSILTKEDYLTRINKMQLKLQEKDIDAVIIFSSEAEPANVRYFTNYWPVFETTALVIPKLGAPILLIGPETVSLVEEHSIIKNFQKLLEFRESSDPEYPDIEHDTFEKVFLTLNDGKPIKKLGIIGTNIMTVQVYEGILEAVGDIEVIKCDELLQQMRMFKSEKEKLLLKNAAKIAMKGFDYALEHIKPGMTEIQAAAECAYGVMSQGAEDTGFKIWVVSGTATTQAIGKSRQKTLEKNEPIQITMGAMVEGYVSSFGRPIVFGKVKDEVKNLFQVGLEANKLTHENMKPGANAADIVKTVHGYVRNAGYVDSIVYGPAHGTGMMECEFPFVESTSNYILQEGMTFAVDTFLACPTFGMRFEDTIALVSGKEEQFANHRREIIIL